MLNVEYEMCCFQLFQFHQSELTSIAIEKQKVKDCRWLQPTSMKYGYPKLLLRFIQCTNVSYG